MVKLKYIDHRPIFIPKLTFYKSGLTLSNGEEIRVSENEAIKLLNQRNGTKPCWEKVGAAKKPKRKKKENDIIEDFEKSEEEILNKEEVN